MKVVDRFFWGTRNEWYVVTQSEGNRITLTPEKNDDQDWFIPGSDFIQRGNQEGDQMKDNCDKYTLGKNPNARYIGVLKWGELLTSVAMDRPAATYEMVMSSKARMVVSEKKDRPEYPRPCKYWRLMFWRVSDWEDLGDDLFRAEFELESITHV